MFVISWYSSSKEQILPSSEIMGRPTKDPKCVVPKRPKSLVWQHFGDNLDGQHARCTLCKEKGKAESLKINDFSTKVLWNHQEQFPILSFMVRIVFAVPCASSKSERVFSVARNTPRGPAWAPTPQRTASSSSATWPSSGIWCQEIIV